MAKARKVYAWKDPSRLGRVVAVVLVINAILFGVSALVDLLFGEAKLIDRDPATALTGPQAIAALASLGNLGALLACVTVLVWIVRANINARTFNPNLKNSPFGSIAWYIVPVASLYKPFEAMSEIWTASARQGDPSGKVLGWWFASFPVPGAMAWISTLAKAGPGAIWAEVGYYLSAIVVSMLLMRIVTQVTRMQVEKRMVADTFGEPEGGPLGVLQQVSS